MKGPLSGIRVLEIGHMLAGPYCGLLLADLGADVIKIEPPEGDIARRVSPHFIGRHNDYFASLNRNKRSVVLDLKSESGQAALHKLVADANALVTNLRPRAIRDLGLTYDALSRYNPKIVCLALTGFGMESPYAERPAYDYVIQAMTGVMQITGEPDAPPTKTGYSAVDNSAGIMAAFGLTAKLLEGKGGQIDLAMYDVMLSQLNYIASAEMNADVTTKRLAGSAHPYIVPAQVFATKAGWLAIFITHDEFWRRFCAELGHLEWLTDARFATMSSRSANRAAVIEAISAVLLEADAKSWARRLIPLGVVAATVTDVAEALECENTKARDMVVNLATADGLIRTIGNPVKIVGFSQENRVPPLLGEHQSLVD
jgi:crotonobetainyl-CoA:carnitine CoA-transferase CaiB-like acyl-CoA transferase